MSGEDIASVEPSFGIGDEVYTINGSVHQYVVHGHVVLPSLRVRYALLLGTMENGEASFVWKDEEDCFATEEALLESL